VIIFMAFLARAGVKLWEVPLTGFFIPVFFFVLARLYRDVGDRIDAVVALLEDQGLLRARSRSVVAFEP